MGRAVIYTRVSTRAQEDGYSLEVQERDGRRYCEGRHEVVGVESDVFTGHDSLEERDGMQAALRLIKRKVADTMVIWRVDRAGRFMVDNLLLLRDVSDAGGSFESVTEGLIPNTPTGKLMLSVHSFAGESEWESIRERTQAGIAARVQKGHLMGAPVPLYGYCWQGEKKERYAIDEESGPWVQRIYDKADQGWSTRRICRWLTESGAPTPSVLAARRGLLGNRRLAAVWTRQTVYNILTTASYCGDHAGLHYKMEKVKVQVDGRQRTMRRRTIRAKDEQVSISVPALVSSEQFERVQQKVKERAFSAEPMTDEPLLNRGFAVCGLCGKRMITMRHHQDGYRMYLCSNRSGQYDDHACPGRAYSIRASRPDEDAWQKVKAIVRDDERYNRLVRSKTARLAEQREDAMRKALHTADELEDAKEKQAMVYERMTYEKDETIRAMHREELKRLNAAIAQLQASAEAAESRAAEAQVEENVHAMLLKGIAAVLKRADVGFYERYLVERGGDPAKAPQLMASMHDAADEVTLDSLDREQRRDIMHLLGVQVRMYPGQRWEFWFTPDGNSFEIVP